VIAPALRFAVVVLVLGCLAVAVAVGAAITLKENAR
jgi:hypothetical protein